jgi:DNA-binding NarL/FixJ family response regulator
MKHLERPYHVLIADDAEEDCCALKTAIHRYSKWKLVGEVHSTDVLLAYLQGEKPYHDRSQHPFPDLLLMDAVLPKGQATDVLRWMRDHPEFTLKVIILAGALIADYCGLLIRQGAHAWVRKTGDPNLLECFVNTIAAELQNNKDKRALEQSH